MTTLPVTPAIMGSCPRSCPPTPGLAGYPTGQPICFFHSGVDRGVSRRVDWVAALLGNAPRLIPAARADSKESNDSPGCQKHQPNPARRSEKRSLLRPRPRRVWQRSGSLEKSRSATPTVGLRRERQGAARRDSPSRPAFPEVGLTGTLLDSARRREHTACNLAFPNHYCSIPGSRR
jgi:hypothetical protein